MTKTEKGNDGMFKYIILVGILIGIVLLLIARYISTKGLEVKEYIINSPTDYNGLQVVHFSDLHYKSTIGDKELKKIVKEINKQKPDIVVFTGDLLDENIVLKDKDKNTLINELKKINSEIETLAVKGNHDYEADYFDEIMKELDWKVLDNTYEFINYQNEKPIVFVGFDDYSDGKPNYENAFSYLKDENNIGYTIVLLHEPDQIDKVKNYNFNIALAGHSHHGQVRFPFIGAVYTPYGSRKYVDGYYKLAENKELYVSNGLGTSSLKVRFLNKPSISLYRFMSK